MNYRCLLPVCAALFLIACAAPPPPSPDTREADIKAVKELEIAWVKDVALKDVDKFAGYYADDASVLMPGEPVLNGKEAIKAALKPMLADPNFALTFENNRADAGKGGDMVYTQGTYSMTMSDPKTAKPVTDKGKFVTVFKKQADGSWKVVADMINSDSPPPPAAK